MVGRSFWIKRCSVDEFKRPCPDVEKDIFTLQLSPTLNDTAESDMRKRAPHIRIDLNGLHSWTLCRNPASAAAEGAPVGDPSYYRGILAAGLGVADRTNRQATKSETWVHPRRGHVPMLRSWDRAMYRRHWAVRFDADGRGATCERR
jgi:hypothetical protein